MLILYNFQVRELIKQDNFHIISTIKVDQGSSALPSTSLLNVCGLFLDLKVLNDSKTQHSMHLSALICNNCLEQENDEEISVVESKGYH